MLACGISTMKGFFLKLGTIEGHMFGEGISRKYLQTPPQSVHLGGLGVVLIGGGGGFVSVVEQLVDVLLLLLLVLLFLSLLEAEGVAVFLL
jgi:hypothetical protein